MMPHRKTAINKLECTQRKFTKYLHFKPNLVCDDNN